jgi:hypothetical protein
LLDGKGAASSKEFAQFQTRVIFSFRYFEQSNHLRFVVRVADVRISPANHALRSDRSTPATDAPAEEGNMTRDELMAAVREYADREHPGWDAASVCICRGNGREPEMMTITPKPSAASLPLESQG